jgi:hypothetical protein
MIQSDLINDSGFRVDLIHHGGVSDDRRNHAWRPMRGCFFSSKRTSTSILQLINPYSLSRQISQPIDLNFITS